MLSFNVLISFPCHWTICKLFKNNRRTCYAFRFDRLQLRAELRRSVFLQRISIGSLVRLLGVVQQQLFNEVDVRQQHASAAIALELECIESVTTAAIAASSTQQTHQPTSTWRERALIVERKQIKVLNTHPSL